MDGFIPKSSYCSRFYNQTLQKSNSLLSSIKSTLKVMHPDRRVEVLLIPADYGLANFIRCFLISSCVVRDTGPLNLPPTPPRDIYRTNSDSYHEFVDTALLNVLVQMKELLKLEIKKNTLLVKDLSYDI